MEKPSVLWHGSSRMIIGEYLLPKRAMDVGGVPENCLEGVYALAKREFAIAMAILKSDGVNGSTLDYSKKSPEGVIINGWPIQDKVYLYKLPTETFYQVSGDQWVSSSRVRPLEIEEIRVKDFIHLIRPANDAEKADFYNMQSAKSRERVLSR